MSNAEKPRVLVVDDNEATCTLLAAILQRDFVIEIASDGQAAIEKLSTKDYATILLDLRMPVHDGFSVLDYLKSSRPEMLRAVLVVTALSRQEVARVRTYNVAGIIPKPFEVDALLAAVKACAGNTGPSLGGVLYTPALMLLELIRERLM